ncbi:MAG: VOC family protein [Planctomycetota bacterium]
MISWNPHLTFDGTCRAAFELYARALGAKPAYFFTYGESPMAATTPAEHHGRILHTTLTLGERTLTGADVLPEQYEKPRGFSVLLQLPTAKDADRIFAALAEGGVIQLALAETFWAPRFGMLTDRFGIPWMLQSK